MKAFYYFCVASFWGGILALNLNEDQTTLFSVLFVVTIVGACGLFLFTFSAITLVAKNKNLGLLTRIICGFLIFFSHMFGGTVLGYFIASYKQNPCAVSKYLFGK